jgi:hypothetical protein
MRWRPFPLFVAAGRVHTPVVPLRRFRGRARRISNRHGAAAAALLLASACAHAPPAELSERVRSGRCEDAASFLRANRRGPPIESRVRKAFTLPLSYVLTGATYGVEVVAVVAGGVVGAVAICSPLLMIDGAIGLKDGVGGACVNTMTDAFLSNGKLPGLGRGVDRATREWRCADTTPISEDLRAIAECYAWRGAEGDLELARSQLEVLMGSRDVLRCASREERRKVERLQAWVRERLEPAT